MLKVHNTLVREKQPFTPIEENKVRFYHCGATVYWNQHIGNMRGMVMADLINRSLMYLGYDVSLVRNYTDVGHLTGDNIGDADIGEDKMEKAAKRENTTPEKIAQKYIDQFEKDTQALNVQPPTYTPRATDYIDEMIAMVETLLDKDYAYITPQAIYFDTSKAKDYTRLSGQDLKENKAHAGSGDVIDSDKRNVADFALWFFKTGTHENALQTWKSPFNSPLVKEGEGFPGWHIECSAMSRSLLGMTLDIHMGGVEHIPVHHTNEIAQSEAANDADFVHYWIHNEHLTVDGGKMSKSEGTSYLVDDIVKKGFNPLSLRYFFLQAHYRSKQNFTWDALTASETAYTRLQDKVNILPEGGSVDKEYEEKFKKALEDDFNIPECLALAWDMLKSDMSDADKRATLLRFDEVFGLQLRETQVRETMAPQEVEQLVEEREMARKNKDWKKADELREEIEKAGFIVKDTDSGSQLTKK